MVTSNGGAAADGFFLCKYEVPIEREKGLGTKKCDPDRRRLASVVFLCVSFVLAPRTDGGTDDDDDRWRDSPPLRERKLDCAMCNHMRVTAIMVPRKLACLKKQISAPRL